VSDPTGSAPTGDGGVVSPAAVHDILTDKPIGYLATTRPDGRLTVTPMAVMFDGTTVQLSTITSRRKFRNLGLDDRVALCVPHRNNPNRYVEIRGRAVLSPDHGRRLVNAIAKKYTDVEDYPFERPGDERVVITILVEHVSSPEIPLADTPPSAPDAR